MNLSELEHLRNPHLSHQSRSLYLLMLRPAREQGELRADLTAISNYLVVKDSPFPTPASYEAAVSCLEELQRHGLICPADHQPHTSWQNVPLSLPYYEAELEELPRRVFRLDLGWRPSANFQRTCILSGLEDSSFSEADLHSFVSYWEGTGELRNQAAWERAFAQRLKKMRTARVAAPRRKSAPKSAGFTPPMAETGIPIAES